MIRDTAVETADSAPPTREPTGPGGSLGVGFRAGHYRVIALDPVV